MRHDPSLADLQIAFFRALREDAAPDGLRPGPGVDVRRRFRIYANQARIAQGDALQAVYRAVCRLVGTEFFANMAALYVEDHSLLHADLRRYGSDLPAFITAFPPLARLPYLADVARLEWACHEALHAGGGVAAGADQRLRLAPHVRLLYSPFPVADIWDFALRDHAPDERLDIGQMVPTYLAIARPRRDVEIMGLAMADWVWLADFAEPESVAGSGNIAQRAYWLARGVLCGAE